MRRDWHILLYHDISFEETPYTRGIEGGTIPPDLLRDHVDTLQKLGDVVSVEDGLARLSSGETLRRPMFSFWFDDGFAGVRRHALPILEAAGVRAALSVCSRFVDRQELHWRLALAWLRHVDGLRALRCALRHRMDTGPANGLLRDATMDRFTPAVAACVLDIYERTTTPAERHAALRLFDDRSGLRTLRDAGWIVCNHSASHWPVGEESALPHFAAQFDECAESLGDLLTAEPDFCVLPFDRSRHRAAALTDTYDAARRRDASYLVLVGNRATTAADLARHMIHRICAPAGSGRALLKTLRVTARRRRSGAAPAAPRAARPSRARDETAAVRPSA